MTKNGLQAFNEVKGPQKATERCKARLIIISLPIFFLKEGGRRGNLPSSMSSENHANTINRMQPKRLA